MEIGVGARALATVFFVFLTAPVAAHMIGRAAYVVGVPLWNGTIVDELHGRYERQTDELPNEPENGMPKPSSQ
jgi:multicomponent Na+:H+ antiporter subunit G